MKKRIISLTLVSLMLIAGATVFTGCARVQQLTDRVSEILNPIDPLVYGVREAVQSDYKVTYGAAFDYFFTNAEWSSFVTDMGVEVVEFSGNCFFRDVYVHARIQFTISEDGNFFEATYLALNGDVQTKELLSILLADAFEAYLRSGQ